MRALDLFFVAEAMNAAFNKNQSGIVKDIVTDSRKISPGSLFIAIPGARVDGHDFIREAEQQGAVGVVVSRSLDTRLPTLLVSDTVLALGKLAKAYRQFFNIPIVAITGSCGKTTVKEMLTCILSEQGSVLSTQGNLNTDIGVPLTLLRLLPEHQYAVIEMGARKKGDIQYLMGLTMPLVTMITNAGVAHQAVFGGQEGIARAKGEIFECLQPGGTAIINADDNYAEYWQSLLNTKQLVLNFGIASSKKLPDIFCKNINLDPTISQFELHTDIGEIKIQLNTPGQHMVQNAIAAAAAARSLDISLLKIKSGLEKFSPIAGRLQFKQGILGAVVIDDTYNANPVSMRAALAVLATSLSKQIFVMGDMVELGEDEEKIHAEIGINAKNLGIDKMFGVGPLTALAVKAFGKNATHYSDKNSLIQALKTEMNQETTVLIKGSRFMQMEDIVLALTTHSQETQSC
jgi:UDP-N-acetylmuramoyl-tripeptide--D-alanyl-D-alanine ligase